MSYDQKLLKYLQARKRAVPTAKLAEHFLRAPSTTSMALRRLLVSGKVTRTTLGTTSYWAAKRDAS